MLLARIDNTKISIKYVRSNRRTNLITRGTHYFWYEMLAQFDESEFLFLDTM